VDQALFHANHRIAEANDLHDGINGLRESVLASFDQMQLKCRQQTAAAAEAATNHVELHRVQQHKDMLMAQSALQKSTEALQQANREKASLETQLAEAQKRGSPAAENGELDINQQLGVQLDLTNGVLREVGNLSIENTWKLQTTREIGQKLAKEPYFQADGAER
jgi:hypothetical protein